jgi:hypothetical protein
LSKNERTGSGRRRAEVICWMKNKSCGFGSGLRASKCLSVAVDAPALKFYPHFLFFIGFCSSGLPISFIYYVSTNWCLFYLCSEAKLYSCWGSASDISFQSDGSATLRKCHDEGLAISSASGLCTQADISTFSLIGIRAKSIKAVTRRGLKTDTGRFLRRVRHAEVLSRAR